MRATITPSQHTGMVTIPPSKSMAHRAIICASFADGISKITNVNYSDDIKITIEGMRQLGAQIEMHDDYVIIQGIKQFQKLNNPTIFCKESGSTLRFFIPIFSLCDQKIKFTGQNRLLKRPQKIYADIFQEKQCHFQQTEEYIEIDGKLPAGNYNLHGDVSSQFISGLLFTLPFLKEDSRIHILPPFESKSYIDLTIEMLERFGVHVEYEDELTLFIPGNQHYHACDYRIEGDFSQFAFHAVLAAIHGDLQINGVDKTSKQGDKSILEILKNANVTVNENENGYFIHKSDIVGSEIDLADCPDLGPILTVLAMYGNGTTRIYNASRLRYKESDRIAAMEEELRKFGVRIRSNEHEIFIEGSTNYTCESLLSSHKDHRIVMSLAVAGICSNSIITIEGAEAVSKSYPGFFDDLTSIGIEVKQDDQ